MRVVIAWIGNAHDQVLIAQRPPDKSYGGYWELPGGKIEWNENPEEALGRELQEELGITVSAGHCIGEVVDEEATPPITFSLFCVTGFKGTPSCCEAQLGLRWICPEDTDTYRFPPINQKILQVFRQHR